MSIPVTITSIRRVDFPPSPTGAYQLAKFDFKIAGLFSYSNAMLGWAPAKGPRLWLQAMRKSGSNYPTIFPAKELSEAVLAAAKQAYEGIGGTYPAQQAPEISAAVALVQEIEKRDAA